MGGWWWKKRLKSQGRQKKESIRAQGPLVKYKRKDRERTFKDMVGL